MPAPPYPPPDPLTWHPAYRTHHLDLLAWLNDPRSGRTIKLPARKTFSLFERREPGLNPDGYLTEHELTKFEVCAPAPYVGELALYTLTIAIDEVGRTIAGELRLIHPGHPEMDVPIDEYDERLLLTEELPT